MNETPVSKCLYTPAFSCLAGDWAAASSDSTWPSAKAFFQCCFGLLERDPGATPVDFLACKTISIDFDICRQQHHVSLGNGLGAEWIARADRALGFDLQVVIQTLGRLLDGFGSHERVRNPGRAGGDRNNARLRTGAIGCLRCDRLRRRMHLRFSLGALQKTVDVLQRMGRRILKQTFADKAAQIHRTGIDHQNEVSGFDVLSRQLLVRLVGIDDFDAGFPALAQCRRFEQSCAEYAADLAVRAGRNYG